MIVAGASPSVFPFPHHGQGIVIVKFTFSMLVYSPLLVVVWWSDHKKEIFFILLSAHGTEIQLQLPDSYFCGAGGNMENTCKPENEVVL